MNDNKRILKMKTCSEVKFFARDADGDMLFVTITGPAAQEILNECHNYAVADLKLTAIGATP